VAAEDARDGHDPRERVRERVDAAGPQPLELRAPVGERCGELFVLGGHRGRTLDHRRSLATP
jgi:hypothetical protein